jgi:hypothetical protein
LPSESARPLAHVAQDEEGEDRQDREHEQRDGGAERDVAAADAEIERAFVDSLETTIWEGGTVVGDQGVVDDVDGDHTRVRIGGALWRARSSGPVLERGERVRVVAVEGLELVVEPEERAAD